MDKNQQVLAIAFKKAKRKIRKIAELQITPDMDEKSIEALTIRLAEAKAIEDGVEIKTLLDGQQWYVESLVKASAFTSQQLIDFEYEESFADTASEDDMASMLDQIKAAA